jgi:hypothetical protein
MLGLVCPFHQKSKVDQKQVVKIFRTFEGTGYEECSFCKKKGHSIHGCFAVAAKALPTGKVRKDWKNFLSTMPEFVMGCEIEEPLVDDFLMDAFRVDSSVVEVPVVLGVVGSAVPVVPKPETFVDDVVKKVVGLIDTSVKALEKCQPVLTRSIGGKGKERDDSVLDQVVDQKEVLIPSFEAVLASVSAEVDSWSDDVVSGDKGDVAEELVAADIPVELSKDCQAFLSDGEDIFLANIDCEEVLEYQFERQFGMAWNRLNVWWQQGPGYDLSRVYAPFGVACAESFSSAAEAIKSRCLVVAHDFLNKDFMNVVDVGVIDQTDTLCSLLGDLAVTARFPVANRVVNSVFGTTRLECVPKVQLVARVGLAHESFVDSLGSVCWQLAACVRDHSRRRRISRVVSTAITLAHVFAPISPMELWRVYWKNHKLSSVKLKACVTVTDDPFADHSVPMGVRDDLVVQEPLYELRCYVRLEYRTDGRIVDVVNTGPGIAKCMHKFLANRTRWEIPADQKPSRMKALVVSGALLANGITHSMLVEGPECDRKRRIAQSVKGSVDVSTHVAEYFKHESRVTVDTVILLEMISSCGVRSLSDVVTLK